MYNHEPLSYGGEVETEFPPSSDLITSILEWIWLSEILVELFEKKLLMRIGNKGRAIKIDRTTSSGSRGLSRRICFQISLCKLLILFVEILGHMQKIEYEGLHIICFECGGYGHTKDNCLKLVKVGKW